MSIVLDGTAGVTTPGLSSTSNATVTGTLAVTGAITSGLKLSTFNTIDQLAIVANTTWGGANQRVLVGIQKSSVGSGGLGIDASDNVTLFNSAGNGQLTVTSTGVTIPGTLGVTGTITPGQTTGIVGTTTNNNAQAGSVGEYVESVVANVSFTTSGGAGNNIASISLTAGDWDVSLTCIIENNGATITTSQITTSKYSGADNTDRVYGSNWIYTYLTGSIGGTISPYRVSVSSSQTVYAKWAGSYTAGTPYMNCRLSARRVR